MLNVRYFYMLNLMLNVSENIKYCLSHFICSLISIYTCMKSAWNLFMMSKQTEKVKKNDKLGLISGWRMCIMLHVNFTKIFRKKIYCYLKWVNCKPFIYLLWTTSIFQLQFWFKNETLGWLTFLDSWNKK